MAVALTVPTTTIMNSWGTISDACLWAGVTDDEWDRLSTAMGEPGLSSLLILASVSDEDWAEVRTEAKLGVARRAAANLMFAAVKAKFNVATTINAAKAVMAPPPMEAGLAEEEEEAKGAEITAQVIPKRTSEGANLPEQGAEEDPTEEPKYEKGASQMASASSKDPIQKTSKSQESSRKSAIVHLDEGTKDRVIDPPLNAWPSGLAPPLDLTAVKVNLGLTINQGLTQEVPMLMESELTPMRERYIAVEGDEPLDNVEVTNAQLTALKAIIGQGMAPYTDFGVWGQHGNRLARKQKFTNMFVDTSGKWHSQELAGPANLDAWRSSWAVFTTAAIMLDVATPAVLNRYANRFVERCQRYPSAWYLAVGADDRCRSEFWVAERRRQERFYREHPALSAFNPERPWESIIKESASNMEWWMREFQEPAMNYMRDRAGAAPSWVTQQFPDEDRGKKRSLQDQPYNVHPKFTRAGEQYTTRDGRTICRPYQTNACNNASCNYAHVCGNCGTEGHSKQDCRKKGKGRGKGKGKGRGKGKARKDKA